MLTVDLTTSDYTDILTVTERLFNGVVCHVQVPDGKKYMYTSILTENYLTFKESFGYSDFDFLSHATVFLDKSTDVNDTKITDPESGEEIDRFNPGESVTILLCEGVDDGTGNLTPNFDLDKYMGGTPETECWKGDFATLQTNAKAPELDITHKVTVESVNRTTRSATFKFTPDEGIIAYTYYFVDEATWNSFEEKLGFDGIVAAFSASGTVANEASEETFTDLQLGVNYKLLVVGKLNDEGTLGTREIVDFTAKEATKPAPEIIVSAVENPDGDISPYYVWFNVKATGKDVVTAKYAANYVSDFAQVLNSGTTFFQLVDQQGTEFTAEDVAKMNSDEGLFLSFTSFEDSKTRLAVIGYNDEETSNMPVIGKPGYGWCDNKTIVEPAKPAVSTSLYEDLAGDWTVHATVYKTKYDENYNSYVALEPVTAKLTIAREMTFPATCPDTAYAVYPDNEKKYVDSLYTDFLESADKFNTKLVNQNRMVCTGMDIVEYNTTYKSPYDLFVDPVYSSYDSDELFFDFGIKFFLEMEEGGKIIIPTDMNKIVPAADFSYTAVYFTAANQTDVDASVTSFDVTLSEGKDTLTVNPVVRGGVEFYPSLMSFYYGYPMEVAKCHDMQFVKGWEGDAAATKASVSKNRKAGVVSGSDHTRNRYRRTKIR